MASVKKNSAFYQQDAIMGKFNAEARRPRELSSVVRDALEKGEANRLYQEARAAKEKLNPPRIYFRYIK